MCCQHCLTWDQLSVAETGLLANLWTENSKGRESHTFYHVNVFFLNALCLCAGVHVCKQWHCCVCVCVTLFYRPLHMPADKWGRESATPTRLQPNCVHSKHFHKLALTRKQRRKSPREGQRQSDQLREWHLEASWMWKWLSVDINYSKTQLGCQKRGHGTDQNTPGINCEYMFGYSGNNWHKMCFYSLSDIKLNLICFILSLSMKMYSYFLKIQNFTYVSSVFSSTTFEPVWLGFKHFGSPSTTFSQ